MSTPMLNRFVKLETVFALMISPLCLAFQNTGAAQVPTVAAAAAPAKSGNAAAVAAAKTFLASLDDAKRAKVLFSFQDETQRKKWSNLPTGIYQRAGVRLADLTPAQREAAMALLRVALSEEGYGKVIGIMEGDEVVRKTSRGGNLIFGRDEYFLSFLGQPSMQTPWLFQFGGHHLALNITYHGNLGTLSPSHTAAQPARFELEGKTIRPLGQENDLAFKLIQSLSPELQKQAILGSQFRDLVLGPGHDGKTIVPEGVKVSGFSADQRKQLLQLAHQWVGIVPDDVAKPKMAEIESQLDQTWFAWSGPTTSGSAAYFRIQGPTVFIEYAPQRMGGDATQHIHTIYRDPTNEYGAKDLKKK